MPMRRFQRLGSFQLKMGMASVGKLISWIIGTTNGLIFIVKEAILYPLDTIKGREMLLFVTAIHHTITQTMIKMIRVLQLLVVLVIMVFL